MVSVIIVCWKRFLHLEQILQVWLAEPEVNEVILWDNSGSFTTSLPITLINSQQNLNPAVRYMLGSIAKNDVIIHCDDDVLPCQGITADFIKYHQSNWFSSIEGIFFTGNSYFHQKRILGQTIASPKRVDMIIGNLTMINKQHLLGHDYFSFSKYQLEMALQLNLQGILPMVIPSNKYIYLPEGKDENALHLMLAGRAEKEEMYKRYSQRNRILQLEMV